MTDYLYYIGKSNKDFTHGKLYPFYGSYSEPNDVDGKFFCISVNNNNNVPIFYSEKYREYVVKNFKYISSIDNKEEYRRIIRKNKLNKLK